MAAASSRLLGAGLRRLSTEKPFVCIEDDDVEEVDEVDGEVGDVSDEDSEADLSAALPLAR